MCEDPDPWDRRTNNTYLRVLFNEGLFAGADLALGEGFPAPDPAAHDYGAFAGYMAGEAERQGYEPQAPSHK